MLPLVAAGRSIGLVELMSVESVPLDPASLDLVRAMANEAAFALENARLYERAQALADRDPLTDFLNHRAFHERLGDELLRAQRARRPVGAADDRPRRLQARQRHARPPRRRPGPALDGGADPWLPSGRPTCRLATAATSSRSSCPTPTCGRRVPPARGSSRPSPATASPPADGAPVPIGVSVGVAAFPTDGRSPGDLVAAADRALYRVKRRGGGGVTAAVDVDEVA